jgi:hypothetical protein
MMVPLVRGVPTFESAVLEGGANGGALPRRRIGTTLLVSTGAHLCLVLGLLVLSLLTVGTIPDPPIVIRFLAAAPPPPRLVPPREARIVPEPPPPVPKKAPPASIPALVVPPAPQEPPPRRPDPPPLKVEPDLPPIQVARNEPRLQVRDVVPDAPRDVVPRIESVDAAPALPAGTGPEPELEYLVPGKSRPRGPGGGLAGRGDGLPPVPGGDPAYGVRPGGGRGAGGFPGGASLSAESSFTTPGLASFLGHKYGVVLVEAKHLGQRTNDGPRYSMLLPMLSEAYRTLPFRGRRRAPSGDVVESVQADRDAIAIRYKDGTLHVLVPTADGLVALYVSAARRGASGRSKVEEAERALSALQRIGLAGVTG